MTANFADVTEIPGEQVTRQQIIRNDHRYIWAAGFCADKDIVEVACGSGQGLGYLAGVARTLEAGDITPQLVAIAQRHYQERVAITQFDALAMPYADRSKDVIIIFEAIYYLPDFDRFLQECERVLRPGGHLLICTANCSLEDFNPSPYSTRYHTVSKLNQELAARNFSALFFGHEDSCQSNFRSVITKTLKQAAVQLGIMPKTMRGKKLLKRLFFGRLIQMPVELSPDVTSFVAPLKIPADKPDKCHRVIYCIAGRCAT